MMNCHYNEEDSINTEYIYLLFYLFKQPSAVFDREDKSSGGTAELIFTSTYPQVSGTGESPPYCEEYN